MLLGLRELEPSLESRLKNRRVIAGELARLGELPSRPSPWWNRSLSIPVPVAIAASLLLMYGATLISDGAGSATVTEAIEQVQPSDPDPVSRPDTYERSSFEITETYLCGVGRLSTHSFYAIEEN